MRNEDAHITKLRGYAWFVFRDPTTSTGPAGAHPFGDLVVEEEVEEAPTEVRLPEGVHAAWRTTITMVGMDNRAPGSDFLVVTDQPKPPPVNEGWDVEPAHLEPNFQMEQSGDRWVRLVRFLDPHHDGAKVLRHCEFEVDHNWQGSGRDRG